MKIIKLSKDVTVFNNKFDLLRGAIDYCNGADWCADCCFDKMCFYFYIR